MARDPRTGLASWTFKMPLGAGGSQNSSGELILADDLLVDGQKHDALIYIASEGQSYTLDRRTGLPLNTANSWNGPNRSSKPSDAAQLCENPDNQSFGAYSPLTQLYYIATGAGCSEAMNSNEAAPMDIWLHGIQLRALSRGKRPTNFPQRPPFWPQGDAWSASAHTTASLNASTRYLERSFTLRNCPPSAKSSLISATEGSL